MIGTLGVHDNFALPIIEAKLANKPMTIRDYFEDELDFDYYYRHPHDYNLVVCLVLTSQVLRYVELIDLYQRDAPAIHSIW